MQWKGRDPAEVFQEHDSAHQERSQPCEEVRQSASQVHSGDDHVKNKIEQERVAGQIGEVQEERQCDQVACHLEGDIAIHRPLPARSVPLAISKRQIVHQHGAADRVQRRRVDDDSQPRRADPDCRQEDETGQPPQGNQPACSFRWEFHESNNNLVEKILQRPHKLYKA